MPRAPRVRRVVWITALLVLVGAGSLLVRGRDVLRPLRRMLTTRVLNPIAAPRATPTPLPVEAATLERQIQGLAGLEAEAKAGALFPDAPHRVLVLVDQGLIQRLLAALTPSEHIVADRYRVVVTGARVVFEDGFALVRLDGRASLAGVAEANVFADLTVVGDLELPMEQRKRDVLNARIHVLAVDAREVAVVARSRQAEGLVEELSRTKLEAFAALASSLEIPLRQEQQITIPPVGPEGPVRIAAASLPVHLTLLSVHAFHGKLWIAMGASIGASAPPSPPATVHPAATVTPAADRNGLSRDELLMRLNEEHRGLHDRFEALIAREALATEAERMRGDMVLVMRAGLLKEVAQAVVRRYFDRVALDLSGIEVTKSGELKADTFLGKVTAGRWTVDLDLHHVRGMLRAREPRIELKAGNEVELDLPVLLEEGEATAALRFAWHSHGVAKIVCKSFEITREVSGRVKPEEYPVRGSFLLATVKDTLAATPRFDPNFLVKVDPSPESWAKVRAALEQQDDIARCGLALDPDKVFAQLQERVAKGFAIHLPRKLLRTVTLPAGVTESVEVEDRRLAVAVTDNALRITPEGLWYGIGIGVRASPAGSSSQP